MAEPKAKVRQSLKSVDDLREAVEDVYNKQFNGEIDAKMSDGLNATLKSAIILNVKLPMDALKLYVQATIKKVTIPAQLKKALPISLE